MCRANCVELICLAVGQLTIELESNELRSDAVQPTEWKMDFLSDSVAASPRPKCQSVPEQRHETGTPLSPSVSTRRLLVGFNAWAVSVAMVIQSREAHRLFLEWLGRHRMCMAWRWWRAYMHAKTFASRLLWWFLAWRILKQLQTAVGSWAEHAGKKFRCWGCDQIEGAASFKNCSLCIELRLVPAKFCSKSCLKANWPRHKAWHKSQRASQERISAQRLQNPAAEFHNANDLQASSQPYLKALGAGRLYGLQSKYSKAAKLYHKAIKIDPHRPEAYFDLGLAYGRSDHDLLALENFIRCFDYAQRGEMLFQRSFPVSILFIIKE